MNTEEEEGEKCWHPSGLGMRLQVLSFTKVSNPGRKTGHIEGKELSFGYIEFEGLVRQSRKVQSRDQKKVLLHRYTETVSTMLSGTSCRWEGEAPEVWLQR